MAKSYKVYQVLKLYQSDFDKYLILNYYKIYKILNLDPRPMFGTLVCLRGYKIMGSLFYLKVTTNETCAKSTQQR